MTLIKSNEEIVEQYKAIFDKEGPEAAEKYLADQDVDVTDLPVEIADGIRSFLDTKLEGTMSMSEAGLSRDIKMNTGEIPSDPQTVA